ncbi:MAG: lysophospholipid acyltransferase family protein [Pseudomonadota bacterium]
MLNTKKQNSHPIKFIIVKSVIALFGHLPPQCSHAFAKALAAFFGLLKTKTKTTVETNVRLVYPGLAPQEQQRLIKDSLQNAMISGFEIAHMWCASVQRIQSIRLEIEGEQHLQDALAYEKGVVLACPHLGNWELLNYYLATHYDLLALYRPPRIMEMESFMQSARQRFGGTLIPASPKGIKQLYRQLDRKKLLAILPDQEPGKSGGIFSPFFGTEALTMTLISRLLRKNHSRLVYAFAERIHPKHYKIHFLPAETDAYSHDLAISTAALNRGVENCIALCPEQYQWTYKRFKTRPLPTDPRIYSV